MPSEAQITELLHPYGVEVSTELAAKIRVYIELLLKWNRKIALTTVTDPEEVVKFHFGESFFAISTGACGKSRLADVGSGAGFPGLALAIAEPSLQVTLIESNLKKCAFLSEVIRQVSISNASVRAMRMEDVSAELTDLDWICARALGRLDELLAWSMERLGPAGSVLLWLGEVDTRKIGSNSDWIWDNPAPIPGSDRRFILRGSPRSAQR
jgi:16S rRNA (guanine527-N7)-methyltransferase